MEEREANLMTSTEQQRQRGEPQAGKAGNAFFDGVARLIAETAGAADGVRREAETVLHSQLQRFLADMDLVPREEFEAARDMAAKALDEVEALRAEVEALRAGAGEGA